tara:strand:+ start:793 stop:1782 length:990 start_codon:yes stop_codon:yes gene_type:complete
MLVSKTPLRVSLFGGGTDYPSFFESNEGKVIGGSIDKYIFTSGLELFKKSKEKFRINYREVESVNNIDEIKHPIIREYLKYNDFKKNYGFSTVSDVPGGTGLGSSSSFSVGFIKLVKSILGEEIKDFELAREAIHLERDLLKENVGVQDQYHAACGGFCEYTFTSNNCKRKILVSSDADLKEISSKFILIYTGSTRKASEILREQEKNNIKGLNDSHLNNMIEITKEASKLISSYNFRFDFKELGNLLNISWDLKKSLSKNVSNFYVDEIIKEAKKIGSLGGKLLGAGNSGFILLLGDNEFIEKSKSYFSKSNLLTFNFVNKSSQIFQL